MENNIEKGTVLDFCKMVSYQSNAVVSVKILEKKTGNVSLFAFDANQKLSEHSAPFDAMVQVLEGDVKILINGIPNLLSKGNSIVMPANIPHAVEAITAFKMLLTMIKEST